MLAREKLILEEAQRQGRAIRVLSIYTVLALILYIVVFILILSAKGIPYE